jgi:hypothetical protein
MGSVHAGRCLKALLVGIASGLILVAPVVFLLLTFPGVPLAVILSEFGLAIAGLLVLGLTAGISGSFAMALLLKGHAPSWS